MKEFTLTAIPKTLDVFLCAVRQVDWPVRIRV